ncbi:sugar transferase [Listeria booriae]|uniref:sugar transferase n=1 Tax=Listeria booriae TaxID=1552123 RepID=UPI0021AB8576|nr:sugar transferase [Listeria booriae]
MKKTLICIITSHRSYKFRTMVVDAEQQKAHLIAQNEVEGHMFKMKEGFCTRLFLAKSIDESLSKAIHRVQATKFLDK